MADRPKTCIIFDLDGTLVDSETLCFQAYLDLLPGLAVTVDTLLLNYRGWAFTDVLRALRETHSMSIPVGFEQVYRARVAVLFDRELKPMPGVLEMLSSLEYATCVASNGEFWGQFTYLASHQNAPSN